MVGKREIFPVCFLATHRATYFETLVRIIPRDGKTECTYGMGKRNSKDTLIASCYQAGKETLKQLQQLFNDTWMVEMVAAHTVGIRA